MIHQGDCLDILPWLDPGSVQCVVTSPPYYGLRDYGTATWKGGDPECDHMHKTGGTESSTFGLASGGHDMSDEARVRSTTRSFVPYAGICPKCGATRIDSQIGLEATPEAYVAKLVEVFRDVRRVLRDDGTVWLNLGDSYMANRGNTAEHPGYDNKAAQGHANLNYVGRKNIPGLKNKDLIGIPWRVAFALQADGWWLRQDIIWHKPNPMPESVTDRCTKAHEYIFLLTKSARYFMDMEAVKEDSIYPGDNRAERKDTRKVVDLMCQDNGSRARTGNPTGITRNRRSVWTITTKPFKGAHFATFPPEIPGICIKAGTSEKGCCPECRSPWERVVEKETLWRERPNQYTSYREINGQPDQRKSGISNTTTGWRPTCTHSLDPVPCIVLDPFSGAGTTGIVAEKLGRKYIGIELNRDYVKMSEDRFESELGGLF